jgi:DNA repair exonuclease SbcCD ATPase subunit
LIIFRKIRWRNFLSTGNSFTEIDCVRNRSTLIVGENGSGKSTILDALSFGLYGKPFRKINKPQLLNSINSKSLEVQIEFSVGKNDYKVIRGMKPAVFEIYQNGNIINQNSESKEYQEMFEKIILKLNFKSFSQIVILGSASFVPFMQLSAAHRREVIDDLLDIQIFSTMNILLKDKIATNKNEIIDNDFNIKNTAEKIELHKKHVDSLEQNNDKIIENKRAKISEYEIQIKEAEDKIAGLNSHIQRLNDEACLLDSLAEQDKKLRELYRKMFDRSAKMIKDNNFYKENDNCPTCRQSISHNFKEHVIEENDKGINEISRGLGKLDTKLKTVSDKIKEYTKSLELQRRLQSEVIEQNNTITVCNQFIKGLEAEIIDIQNNTKHIDASNEQIKELKDDLRRAIALKEELIEHRRTLDVASMLLKDSGIKTKIIKQYVPVMNKLINKYLASMDFFVNFELNENFEESIKSRFRDEFSYDSFSEGEKMRIDLALLFAWRAIAKLRNSASTNLLIMDEVFDSSLDNSGTDEFLKIIQGITADTNIFIISHKGDTLMDKFHSIIRFEKHKNFSRIAIGGN